MAELQTIIAAIKDVLDAVSPPSGQQDLKVFDDPVEAINAIPSALILEEEVPLEVALGAGEEFMEPGALIGVHLLFAQADVKYAVRARRAWLKPIRDAFNLDANKKLGGTADACFVRAVTFEPFLYGMNEAAYAQAHFHLEVIATD